MPRCMLCRGSIRCRNRSATWVLPPSDDFHCAVRCPLAPQGRLATLLRSADQARQDRYSFTITAFADEHKVGGYGDAMREYLSQSALDLFAPFLNEAENPRVGNELGRHSYLSAGRSHGESRYRHHGLFVGEPLAAARSCLLGMGADTAGALQFLAAGPRPSLRRRWNPFCRTK